MATISMIFPRTDQSRPNFDLLRVRTDLPERCNISVPVEINNIYRNAVRAQKYFQERRSVT